MVEVDLGFCSRCGGQLERCEGGGPNRSCCSVCGFVVYTNPSPVVVATVVDEDHALLVKRSRSPERGCWSMPGGYMEMDETPEAGAARELAEETGIVVDPSDLTFVGTDYEPFDDGRAVVDMIFAAPRERVSGDPVPGDDAAEVRYWTREEIANDPDDLRVGDPESVLWAIDTLSSAERAPLW